MKSISTKNTAELELEAAKIKINQLELKVKTLEEENKYLRQKTSQSNHNTTTPNLLMTSSVGGPMTNNYTNYDLDLGRLSLGPKSMQSHQ
mgnify:CR=1 FL=1